MCIFVVCTSRRSDFCDRVLKLVWKHFFFGAVWKQSCYQHFKRTSCITVMNMYSFLHSGMHWLRTPCLMEKMSGILMLLCILCVQKEYHNDYEHSKWKYTPVADPADMQHHLLNKKITSSVPLFTNPSLIPFVWFAVWEGLSPFEKKKFFFFHTI